MRYVHKFECVISDIVCINVNVPYQLTQASEWHEIQCPILSHLIYMFEDPKIDKFDFLVLSASDTLCLYRHIHYWHSNANIWRMLPKMQMYTVCRLKKRKRFIVLRCLIRNDDNVCDVDTAKCACVLWFSRISTLDEKKMLPLQWVSKISLKF